MKWACKESALGHALAPARDEEALWSGWKCAHCGELFKRPGDSDSYELPLMESVVEVDALALMLDGHVDGGWRASAGWVHELERRSVESGLFMHVDGEWAEVAEAILELEAWADSLLHDEPSAPMLMGQLAMDAWTKVKRVTDEVPRLLEASALLRDGWRPGAKRRAK